MQAHFHTELSEPRPVLVMQLVQVSAECAFLVTRTVTFAPTLAICKSLIQEARARALRSPAHVLSLFGSHRMLQELHRLLSSHDQNDSTPETLHCVDVDRKSGIETRVLKRIKAEISVGQKLLPAALMELAPPLIHGPRAGERGW